MTSYDRGMNSQNTQAPADERDADLSPEEPLVTEELLVEEISIDGMCGVY